MPRDAVSRTANVGTVGKNGLMMRRCFGDSTWHLPVAYFSMRIPYIIYGIYMCYICTEYIYGIYKYIICALHCNLIFIHSDSFLNIFKKIVCVYCNYLISMSLWWNQLFVFTVIIVMFTIKHWCPMLTLITAWFY